MSDGPRSYRPRVQVEAWQVTTDNVRAIARWTNGEHWSIPGESCVWIDNEDTDSQQRVRPGDYVVRGVTGRFFRVRAEEFDESYEEIQA